MTARRLGIAIEPGTLTVATDGAETFTLPYSGEGALAESFAAIRATVGPVSLVSVALLPPLATTRLLELPRVTASERRALLTRDAERFFPNVTGLQEVTAVVLRSEGGRQLVRVSRSDASLVQAIERAAASTSWTLDGVVPADLAWAVAGRRRGRGTRAVLLEHARQWRAIALTTRGGGLVRSSAAPLDGTSAGSLVGVPAQSVAVLTAGPSGEAASAIAARFADAVPNGQLRSPAAMAASAARAKRWSLGLLAGAAALLLMAGGFEMWGLHRELSAVRARREAIRPAVQEAMAARTAVSSITDRLMTLDSAGRTAPRWSSVIAALTDELPADAYLSAFRATGDTLRIEGNASHAADVFESLQRAPWATSVRAEAPIRQESNADGVPIERFMLGARLVGRETTR